MKLSVVIPVMNEAEIIPSLFAALAASLGGIDHEIILVDDGSTDNTVAAIQKAASSGTRLVILNKNYGQTTAMAAGIDHAQGELIATMDGDL
ncbi:MAG: glycosyltransferase, partial [Chlorobiaceae bacterium]|nr:glycosyltransferase [Chlorobiaceae bacterium]